MQRVFKASYVAPHEPYELPKKFRHEDNPKYSVMRRHRFLYNKADGSVLGRTPFSWLQILVFYLCFYAGLALLCYLCWLGFAPTLSRARPSVLMRQPGFSAQPMLSQSLLVEYGTQNGDQVFEHVKRINKFLAKYGAVPANAFAGCTLAEDFGFAAGTPCIFLKVNRVVGFKVDPYENPGQLPAAAPQQLKALLDGLQPEEQKGRVWITCTSDLADQPTFTFTPQQWVPVAPLEVNNVVLYEGEFYTQDDFQRIVAVKVSNFPFGRRFRIKCHLWAKNIKQDEEGHPGEGVVKFSLLVKN